MNTRQALECCNTSDLRWLNIVMNCCNPLINYIDRIGILTAYYAAYFPFNFRTMTAGTLCASSPPKMLATHESCHHTSDGPWPAVLSISSPDWTKASETPPVFSMEKQTDLTVGVIRDAKFFLGTPSLPRFGSQARNTFDRHICDIMLYWYSPRRSHAQRQLTRKVLLVIF